MAIPVAMRMDLELKDTELARDDISKRYERLVMGRRLKGILKPWPREG